MRVNEWLICSKELSLKKSLQKLATQSLNKSVVWIYFYSIKSSRLLSSVYPVERGVVDDSSEKQKLYYPEQGFQKAVLYGWLYAHI